VLTSANLRLVASMPGKKQNQPSARRGGKKNNTQSVMWNKPQTTRQKTARRKLMLANQNLPPRPQRTQRQIGNAIRVRLPTVGMSDIMEHRITWVAGTVYVGNNTLGANNSVYMSNQAKTSTYVAGSGGGFWIPFAPSDVDVGATYAASIMKLYRRVRIRRAKIHLLTIQSSTTNNAVVAVAPCRGPPGAAEFANFASDTTAAQTLQNIMSISGMDSCDCFENLTLDLTPYIAGGAGAAQNEFAVANSGSATTEIGQAYNTLGVVPCAFQIAGNSTVSALQGTSTHNVVLEMTCDLIDFVGAVPVIDPEEFRRKLDKTKEERRGRLLSELSALSRDDKAKRDLSASPTRLP